MAVQFQKALIKHLCLPICEATYRNSGIFHFPKWQRKLGKFLTGFSNLCLLFSFIVSGMWRPLFTAGVIQNFDHFCAKMYKTYFGFMRFFFFYFIKENWLHSKTCFLMLSLLWKICCKWVLKITFFKGKPPALTTLSVNTKEVSKCLCISHSQWLHIQIRGKIPFLEWLVGKPHSDV